MRATKPQDRLRVRLDGKPPVGVVTITFANANVFSDELPLRAESPTC